MIDRPRARRRARISRFTLAFACAFFCATGARAQIVLPPQGRPVTAKDISGKKICWDSGHWIAFGRDGYFTSDKSAHKKWSVPEPGVLRTGARERETEVLPDGQLHMHWFVLYRGKGDRNIDHWGKVCG